MKYVNDLRRNEPRNIGVILSVDGKAYCRFLGEIDGKIDGRSTRGLIRSHENYKDWVDYWKHSVQKNGWEKRLTARRRTKNYYIERSGERIVGTVSDADVFADQLFANLIRMRDQPDEVPSAKERAVSVFSRLNIKERVEENIIVDPARHVRFDYKFMNGAAHLMRAISVGSERDSWNNAQLAMFAFEHVPEKVDGRAPNNIALVSGESDQKPELLKLLRERSRIVDMDDEDAAAIELQQMFGLSSSVLF